MKSPQKIMLLSACMYSIPHKIRLVPIYFKWAWWISISVKLPDGKILPIHCTMTKQNVETEKSLWSIGYIQYIHLQAIHVPLLCLVAMMIVSYNPRHGNKELIK